MDGVLIISCAERQPANFLDFFEKNIHAARLLYYSHYILYMVSIPSIIVIMALNTILT